MNENRVTAALAASAGSGLVGFWIARTTESAGRGAAARPPRAGGATCAATVVDAVRYRQKTVTAARVARGPRGGIFADKVIPEFRPGRWLVQSGRGSGPVTPRGASGRVFPR